MLSDKLIEVSKFCTMLSPNDFTFLLCMFKIVQTQLIFIDYPSCGNYYEKRNNACDINRHKSGVAA